MVAEGAPDAGLGGWGVGKGVMGQEVAMLVGGFVKVLVQQVKQVKYW